MKNALRFLLFLVMVFMIWWTFWRRQEQAEVIRNGASTEARLLLAMDDTHTGVMDVQSGTGVIAYANGAARDIFGYVDMSGLPVSELLPEVFRPTHAEKMNGAMVPGAPSHVAVMKCIAKRKDGEQIAVVVRVNISRNGVQAMVNRADEMTYVDMTNPPP